MHCSGREGFGRPAPPGHMHTPAAAAPVEDEHGASGRKQDGAGGSPPRAPEGRRLAREGRAVHCGEPREARGVMLADHLPPRHSPAMTRLHRLVAAFLVPAALACAPRVATPHRTAAPDPPEVLLRLDDVGMNHSVNLGVARVAATGMPFSVSVLFACPWYQEAVEILKKNPHVTVGVHLALNSEWRNYRWGPVR